MTPSQQQLLEIIPSLRDWQSRFLLRFLQFLRWNRPISVPQENYGSVVDPLGSFIGSVQHGSLAQSIDDELYD